MATWQPTITPVYGQQNLDGWQVVWGPGVAVGDTFNAVGSTIGLGSNAIPAPGGGFIAGYADKTVQVVGLTGSEVIQFQGSNDGVNFADMSDAQGNPISISLSTPPLLKQLEEVVIQVKPAVISGSGSASLAIIMFARKTQNP